MENQRPETAVFDPFFDYFYLITTQKCKLFPCFSSVCDMQSSIMGEFSGRHPLKMKIDVGRGAKGADRRLRRDEKDRIK